MGNDPRQLSFGFALWTRSMIAQLIAREFGVSLSEVSVGRLLTTMGLSPQRPPRRAHRQDPEAVERWKGQEFPAIRGAAKKEGAAVYFGDEAGMRPDCHSGAAWAPIGGTPVVANTGARWSVNMLSAVSAQGKPRFMARDGKVDSAVFIDFCKRLTGDAQAPVHLIVDGHPCHRSKATRQFVADTNGKLTLFTLPSHSPEPNPDEWVWKNVKHDRIGKMGVTSKDDLKSKAIGAPPRPRELPHLVEGFFRDPNLAHITA